MKLLLIIEGSARVAVDRLLSPDGHNLHVINVAKRADVPRDLIDAAEEIISVQAKWFKRKETK